MIKRMPWDLTDEGKKNILETLEEKFANAELDLDNKAKTTLRKNTIINIDQYELIMLRFSIEAYKKSRSNYGKNKNGGVYKHAGKE